MTVHLEPRVGSLRSLLSGDVAVRNIVAANLFAIVVAVLSGEALLLLLWTYWLQSVVIGVYAYRRIGRLRAFSTEGLKINGRAATPTAATQRWTKNFFAVHYGFFHLVYFMFLGSFGAMGGMVGSLGRWDPLIIAALGGGFWLTHRRSHLEHVEADLAGRPNLGALMFLPYARVIPMHITIILGAVIGSGPGVVLFGLLKTGADVTMHVVEHRLLQRLPGAGTGRASGGADARS